MLESSRQKDELVRTFRKDVPRTHQGRVGEEGDEVQAAWFRELPATKRKHGKGLQNKKKSGMC